MNNINDKTKKRLIIFGGLAVSIVLIILIAAQFKKEPVKEADIPMQSIETSVAAVDSQNKLQIKEAESTTAKISEDSQKVNGAVDTGTEQKIQGDVPKKPTKPSTDSTKTPSVEKTDPPKAGDTPLPSTSTPKPAKPEKKIEKKVETTKTQPSGGLPGFDNVPDGGENQVTEAGEMYENGNKIGDMN